ncbi:HypC/HybG/HupF family hydrogenase formation chaperone [Dehalobacterium formicoaceticum]|uniref:HypC/HybG/HupF family hydrogenase formation chaperone n=1 Tax=Dehalobacterium formicoaceticum TaxID=51515 RepID=A0ABT1Y4I3_9FIRM|nr:HypC/HybG/HupF family hydrogenase formation chaperone [Dehalobacterium formicoaceticum]MCR6545781.1 HypC/HybG/HupF family hydrogenase formation chaperone [Dehalobacterium formicoaceticum]
MFLGVPAQVMDIKNKIGIVKIDGIFVKVSLDLASEVNVGDYVLVHAGFAIQVISCEEAALTWTNINKMMDNTRHN